MFKKLILPTAFVFAAAVPVSIAEADYHEAVPATQTVSLVSHFGMVDNVLQTKTYSRIDAKIVTTQPWKKPEIANQQLSNTELISILKQAGFAGEGLKMAWAIVQKESTSRPYAHNDNPSTGDNSYGLFQINMFRSLEASRLQKYNLDKNEDLFDPLTNARIAYQISDGGKSWGAWTTRKSAQEILDQFPN